MSIDIIQEIDWNKRITKEPGRYLIIEENGMIKEVHDVRTNEIWFRVGKGNRWMRL